MSHQAWTLVGLHASVRYTVTADPSACLLPRLLQPFARRDLIPNALTAIRKNETVRVEIALSAMPAEMVQVVAGNLRQLVGVHSVAHNQEITGHVRRQAA